MVENITSEEYIGWLLMKLPGAEGEDYEILKEALDRVTTQVEHLERCYALKY